MSNEGLKFATEKCERIEDRKLAEEAASCVSHMSKHKDFMENQNIQIKDKWVGNNVNKFQLNPTVDVVTMTVLLKEV